MPQHIRRGESGKATMSCEVNQQSANSGRIGKIAMTNSNQGAQRRSSGSADESDAIGMRPLVAYRHVRLKSKAVVIFCMAFCATLSGVGAVAKEAPRLYPLQLELPKSSAGKETSVDEICILGWSRKGAFAYLRLHYSDGGGLSSAFWRSRIS
jgi:hypothetical protein